MKEDLTLLREGGRLVLTSIKLSWECPTELDKISSLPNILMTPDCENKGGISTQYNSNIPYFDTEYIVRDNNCPL